MADNPVTIDQGDLDDLGDKLVISQKEIVQALSKGKVGALILQTMRRSAWMNAPIDTGTLKQSIQVSTPRVEGDVVKLNIHTNTYYAIFQEYGTGIKGDPEIPHTQKAFWYQFDGYDEKGNPKFIKRYAQKGHRFMRGAIEGGNLENIKDILADNLKNVFVEELK